MVVDGLIEELAVSLEDEPDDDLAYYRLPTGATGGAAEARRWMRWSGARARRLIPGRPGAR